MQLFFTHLPDEHLEQAANHEQCIVGLPDKQLTVEEKQRKNIAFKVKQKKNEVTKIDAVKGLAGSTLLVLCPRFPKETLVDCVCSSVI